MEVYLRIRSLKMTESQFIPLIIYENKLDETIKKYTDLCYSIEIMKNLPQGIK